MEGGHLARFERTLNIKVENVWAALTENDQLVKWMPNLEIVDLKQNGTIQFHMNDGTGNSFEIKILNFKVNEVLQFDWGEGWVRFELHPKSEGSLLVLEEFIKTINDHTPKDLAGWHVCLELMIDLLNGHVHGEFPKENWQKLYEKYVELLRK